MADDKSTREFGIELLKKNKYSSEKNQATSNPFDAYANYVALIFEKLKQNPGFTITQAALKAMNPNPPKIYNPLAPFGPPPGALGFITDSIDAPTSSGMLPKRDIIREAMKGNLVKVHKTPGGTAVQGPLLKFGGVGVNGVNINGKNAEEYNNSLNLYNDRKDRTKNSLIEINSPEQTGKKGMTIREPVPGVKYDVPDFQAIFDKKSTGPDFDSGNAGAFFFSPKPGALFSKNRKQIEMERQFKNDDVFFNRQDYEAGYIEGDDFETLFMGDFVYIPFYFEDVRKPGRRIYFRAFLTRFSESITPEYNIEKVFGRTDPIPVYKNTTRTFSIGFKIAAFSPAGFSSMWKKVNNLSKMMYPTFKDHVMSASPILRVRIGDVLANDAGNGLHGFPSSLEFDYSNSPWEIEKFNGPVNALEGSADQKTEIGKAPMIIDASFSFTVIHERNPQIDENYNFDVGVFRRIGSLEDSFFRDLAGENPSNEVEDETRSDTGVGEE